MSAGEGRLAAAKVAAELAGQAVPAGQAMARELAAQIPELGEDAEVRQLTQASCAANVEEFLLLVQEVIPLDRAKASAAALEYARRLARRGVGLDAILRSYRLGQDFFWRQWSAELAGAVEDRQQLLEALDETSRLMFQFVDAICTEITSAYAAERERFLRGALAARAGTVQAILAGQEVDPEAIEGSLRYALRGWHLALVCWTSQPRNAGGVLLELERVVGALLTEVGLGRPLVVAQDGSSLWAWIKVQGDRALDAEALTRVVAEAGPATHAALGDPGEGVEGFRRSHRQALAARSVGAAAGAGAPPVLLFRDTLLVALVSGDLEAARGFVEAALGGLAQDDEAHEQLRDTVRIFLGEDGSYERAAKALHLHRNGVRYRISRAEEVRGRPLREGRLELEVALLLCGRLGTAVLPRSDAAHSDPR